MLLQIANKTPEWTDPDGTVHQDITLPPWILTEDPADWVSYGNDTVRTTEEGQDLTYNLKIHYYRYDSGQWTDLDSSSFSNSSQAGYLWTNGWRQGRIHSEGAWLLFNINSGEILWRPNNADVTQYADQPDPGTPSGTSIDGRAYTFTLTGNDGNGGITVPAKSFDVTVDNVTTVLTGSSLDGNNRVANPIRDTPITVQEDATFTVDVYASSVYGGDEDVDLGGSVGAQARMDTDYGLRLWDSVNAAWVDIASSGTRANSSGGLITFNRDSGVVNWTPERPRYWECPVSHLPL